jgi:hypothetical protein
MDLSVLFCNQIKELEMGGACSKNSEDRNAYKVFVGKPTGKKQPGRHRRKC